MFQGQLFILLVIYIGNSSCAIDALYDAGTELWKLHKMIDKMKFDGYQDIKDVAELFTGYNVRNREVGDQINKIDKQLDQLERSINLKMIQYSFKLLPSEILLFRSIDTFDLFISTIDKYYGKFHEYINETSHDSDLPLQDITRDIILDAEGYIQIVRKIMTEPKELLPGHKTLADAIIDYVLRHDTTICDVPNIISTVLMKLFTISVIAEIKINVMVTFANIHRQIQNQGNIQWKIMNSLAKEKFRNQFELYLNLFRENLYSTDAVYLRACDPDKGIWIRNESFYELEGTFQTTIFRYRWMKCKLASCNNIMFDKNVDCDREIYDYRSSCSGIANNCFYLSAVQACVLKSGPYKFQYVNSTELGSFGKNFNCPKKEGYLINDGAGWNFTMATCGCDCYGNHNKISLALMESRTELNRVIIGLRFIRKNDILYIQPREGKLNANGFIDKYSKRWIPIATYSRTSQIHTIDRENRVFFLDDVRLPQRYVLTGVQFNRVTRRTVEGFAIEIFGVPFDYKSGNLFFDGKNRISRQASKYALGEALSFNPVSSVLTSLPHSIISEKIGYISLKKSTLQQDFGQSTLPFFDAVPITPTPSVLGGIGIFHKGVEGYAGFLSIRVYGIQYANYFEDFKRSNMADGKIIFRQCERI